jgi:hypothetical protein
VIRHGILALASALLVAFGANPGMSTMRESRERVTLAAVRCENPAARDNTLRVHVVESAGTAGWDVPVEILSSNAEQTLSTFLLPAGHYSARVQWRECTWNGPLTVLPGVDRHVSVLMAPNAFTLHDSDRSIAGKIPTTGMLVEVVSITVLSPSSGEKKASCRRADRVASVDGDHFYAEGLRDGRLYLRVSMSGGGGVANILVEESNKEPMSAQMREHIVKDISYAEYRRAEKDTLRGVGTLDCTLKSQLVSSRPGDAGPMK